MTPSVQEDMEAPLFKKEKVTPYEIARPKSSLATFSKLKGATIRPLTKKPVKMAIPRLELPPF